MGYQKLTPGHEEQIKNMRKDGKSPQEVVDFFKENYQIKMPLWKVSYITSKKSTGVASAEVPRRRAAQRKYSDKRKHVEEEETGNEDFVAHVRAAFELYKKSAVDGFIQAAKEVIEKG